MSTLPVPPVTLSLASHEELLMNVRLTMEGASTYVSTLMTAISVVVDKDIICLKTTAVKVHVLLVIQQVSSVFVIMCLIFFFFFPSFFVEGRVFYSSYKL